MNLDPYPLTVTLTVNISSLQTLIYVTQTPTQPFPAFIKSLKPCHMSSESRYWERGSCGHNNNDFSFFPTAVNVETIIYCRHIGSMQRPEFLTQESWIHESWTEVKNFMDIMIMYFVFVPMVWCREEYFLRLIHVQYMAILAAPNNLNHWPRGYELLNFWKRAPWTPLSCLPLL